MLEIYCSGSPWEVGLTHGQKARVPISRSIEFYAQMFQDSSQMNWARVQELAMEFEPVIREKWPAYLEEMSGVAEGAGVALPEILGLNVRTEIAFGLFSDGCTALSWKTEAGASYLAQNWDWDPRQKQNLVQLTVVQPSKPEIKMITEAGIIGKIGLNSAGVGVCLNAIRARGMESTRLPCHLGLRAVLESSSKDDAVAMLEKYGLASACHMLIADAATGGIGLEWSSVDVRKIATNPDGQVFHTNHYLVEHKGVDDTNWMEDSNYRLGRIEVLARGVDSSNVSKETMFELFKDQENWPGAICRSAEGKSTAATLFNIVMDLQAKSAQVCLGRPAEPDEKLTLAF